VYADHFGANGERFTIYKTICFVSGAPYMHCVVGRRNSLVIYMYAVIDVNI